MFIEDSACDLMGSSLGGINVFDHLLVPFDGHGGIQVAVIIDHLHCFGHLHIGADIAYDRRDIDQINRRLSAGAVF